MECLMQEHHLYLYFQYQEDALSMSVPDLGFLLSFLLFYPIEPSKDQS